MRRSVSLARTASSQSAIATRSSCSSCFLRLPFVATLSRPVSMTHLLVMARTHACDSHARWNSRAVGADELLREDLVRLRLDRFERGICDLRIRIREHDDADAFAFAEAVRARDAGERAVMSPH